jgi:hypothetical protein
MFASLISKPGRGLSDRADLTVGVIAAQLIAQADSRSHHPIAKKSRR